MHIPFAVFISLALTLPTLAAPGVQNTEDLATRTTENDTTVNTFVPSAFIGDDSELEARAKKTATKTKAPIATKSASKKPTATSASATPSASAVTTCSLGSSSKSKTKVKTPTSAKFRSLSERSIATTQFHATCRSFAEGIKSAVKAGTFTLQPKRIWPNEFTWSGGFYITPDEDKAQLFGATFLANTCADKGGVVVLEFSFDTSDLKVKDVGTNKSIVDKFRGTQSKLGSAIKRFLKKKQDPVDPPADEGVGNDDSPSANHIPIPSNAVVEEIPAKSLPAVLKTAFEEFKTLDVVAGAGSLAASQRVLIEDAQQVGIPPLKEPFNQVVLVTDKAMKNLKFLKQEDLPTCLAEKQPELVDFLKNKAASNPDA